MLSAEQEAQRAAHIEIGADRAFILTAALPVEPDERVAALYRTLLLGGLAELGHKQTEFRHWLRAHEHILFPRTENEARWDLVLLRRVVELWTHVLRGAGPSGLEHAMEIVASIREERPVREPAFFATVDPVDEPRMRFYAFTLFHLTEAATELLLFRLHGEPERVDARHVQPLHARARRRRRRSASRCELRLVVRGVSPRRRAANCATRAAPRSERLS